MQTQHNFVIEEENATIITKVEDTLDESETTCSNENAPKADDCIYESVDDPLHLGLNEEDGNYEDAGNSTLELNDASNELPTEENSADK